MSMTTKQAVRILETKKKQPSTDWKYAEVLTMAVEALKAQKTGHWIDVDTVWCKCSECDAHRKMDLGYKEYFCPNCGVRMQKWKGGTE